MSEIQGYVKRIVYHSELTGYYVLTIETEDKEITATGNIPSVSEGQLLLLTGEIVNHPSYGEQFKFVKCEIKQLEDRVSIERYLASGTIKGIGQAMAKRIVKKFGTDAFRIMEQEPERLVEIKGISERIAMNIAEQMQEKKDIREAMMFLQDLGIGTKLAAKIYAYYEGRVIEVLRENPYLLVEDIQGVGFKTADEIAKKAGIKTDSRYRLQAGIIYVLSEAMAEGHVYLPYSYLCQKAMSVLETGEEDVKLQIENLLIDGRLISKSEGENEKIYTSMCYYMELNSARLLLDINAPKLKKHKNLEASIAKIEKAAGIELDEKQREAVLMAIENGVSVITGGPGTGKTTIIKLLLDYFDKNGMDVMLAAPTGRAAKRMTETTGYEASTIHRMLEMGIGGMEGCRNEENPLEADVVIVDEMSMVDIFLFHTLLKAVAIGTKLILVGDVNQLPSVGPGSVLKDIIESRCFEVAILDKIFRQAALSDIVINAHKINNGENILLDNKSQDFFFLERDNIEVIRQTLIYLIKEKLPKYVKADPFEIQVMTPMRKGPLGVEGLNQFLQDALNPQRPGREDFVLGDLRLREGDKVMQIKNNYQLTWEVRSKFGILIDSGQGIFNGDIGVVREIDKAAGQVTIAYDDDRKVVYGIPDLEEIELAYAITIHKSQGSEYPAVILPLLNGPSMLMSRNLLYTAVTRAKSCVLIIGSGNTVQNMIANKNEMKRFCSMDERIRELKGIDQEK